VIDKTNAYGADFLRRLKASGEMYKKEAVTLKLRNEIEGFLFQGSDWSGATTRPEFDYVNTVDTTFTPGILAKFYRYHCGSAAARWASKMRRTIEVAPFPIRKLTRYVKWCRAAESDSTIPNDLPPGATEWARRRRFLPSRSRRERNGMHTNVSTQHGGKNITGSEGRESSAVWLVVCGSLLTHGTYLFCCHASVLPVSPGFDPHSSAKSLRLLTVDRAS